ncbi:MAG: 50S ribosomal protein L10 [Clostridiales bacterium]|jgi:large subunit ribosomal protein L10|nr:50S ribosomal protein L10 [Clostridiales bacterium]
MPKIESKQAVINEIKDKLAKAKSVVLVDARGLTVAQDTSLRKTLREAGVDYKVYKNTMLSFAIKDTEFQGLDKLLFGPSAVAISYGDPTVAAATIFKQFKAMPKLEFKGGIVDNAYYDAAGMSVVAEIPSREVLLAKLLGSWKAPMAAFARLAAALAEQKAGPAPEAPAEA